MLELKNKIDKLWIPKLCWYKKIKHINFGSLNYVTVKKIKYINFGFLRLLVLKIKYIDFGYLKYVSVKK